MVSLNFKEICRRLEKIKLPACDIVVGIGEGGLVPASLAANKLGSELCMVKINYRNKNNLPQHKNPKTLTKLQLPLGVKRVLLVDDVSVSGKTLSLAKKMLTGFKVKTFVFKGKADYVLFPEIEDCISWPWSEYEK
jgi:hypoxanthine phosphoribosyltransferase